MRGRASDIERRLVVPYAIAMAGANVVGAVIVFVFVRFLLPLPDVDDRDAAQRANAITFVAYLAIAVPAGAVWTVRMLAPVRAWLRANRPPDAREQRLALLVPARQLLVHGSLWALAVAAFTALNATFGWRLALLVAIAAGLGAIATCAVAYLLAQRLLRPVTARALAHDVPERPALPGVAARVLLTWALCTGVPLVGLALVGAGELTGVLGASADRLAATAVFLGGIAALVGLAGMALTARSLADPLEAVRHALARVGRGETDVEVPVTDGSEVGLLQAGFNRMVVAVGERERLRDLFGRQVGEDVARQALERGITLGGEERDVAVLFVDVVGSTELASERPPKEVVDLLNDFFRVVIDVVGDHGGAVNKFEGDAALCVFGAPLEHDDAAGAALAAARELRDRLTEDVPGLEAGIGVSAGPAVAGNVGAEERFEYTVIGDPVNEAARLTELAKEREGRVLAAGRAVEQAGGDEASRWEVEGEETLRGRSEPTRLAVPASGVDQAASRASGAPQASRDGGGGTL